jgi:hypothetical protein
MKKSILLITFSLASALLCAQDLTSKKGEPILPEKGDWALGIDATPFLNYIGNFFGNPNNAPTFNWLTTNNSIVGKYFLDDKTALRLGLRIGFSSNTSRYATSDRAASLTPGTYPAAQAQKENTWKTSSSGFGLSAGIERRKGKTRLQGIYGAETGFFVSTFKDKFTYGNSLVAPGNGITAITVDAVGDSIPNSGNINKTPPVQGTDGNGARITTRKTGTQFSFGIRGFVGVEYFILPKMSLGGEFGWGIGFTTIGKSSTIYETSGSTTLGSSIATTEIAGQKGGSFKIDTDNKNSMWGPSGAIRLNFYF